MQDYFYQIADALQNLLKNDEQLTCWFSGEQSDFVRYNHAKVRQAGAVTQQSINVDLINGQQHASSNLTLTGDFDQDQPQLQTLIEQLRETYPNLPEDPYLLYSQEINNSESIHANTLPNATQINENVLDTVDGLDFVGILASGEIAYGFANSLGQRNWYSRPSFNLDWSVYLHSD